MSGENIPNDRLHIEDGPAIEHVDGTIYWYLEWEQYTEEEFNLKMNPEPSYEGKVVEIEGKKYKFTEVK